MAKTHRMVIHGIDPEVCDWLRARAAENKRSMSSEAKAILADRMRAEEDASRHALGR